MAETYKALGSAKFTPADTQIYLVPAATQAIVKFVVITCTADGQACSLRTFSPALGVLPFISALVLNNGEWAEWDGSLTLAAGSTVLGKTTTDQQVSATLYGLEIS
jgi:hypothetical protein